MNRAKAETALAALGYEFDWSVTGPSEGYWSGTFDAIGRNCIDGDCRGEVVHGDNAADFYKNAVAAARSYSIGPQPCPHRPGKCDFHDPPTDQ